MSHTAILIGLCAWTRAGKDTVAAYLEERHDLYTTALAEPLYAMLAESGRLDSAFLHDHMKDQPIEAFNGRTAREIIQSLGDWYLANFGEDALVRNVAEVWADLRKDAVGLVVSDVRTDAELTWIRDNGGVIWWIGRPGTAAINGHRTEGYDRLFEAFHDPMLGDQQLSNQGTIHFLEPQIEAALASTYRRAAA